jgi:hypothetical protein
VNGWYLRRGEEQEKRRGRGGKGKNFVLANLHRM